MALSDKTKEVLLFNLFYGENTQYTNEKDLYEAVKNKGITHKEVKDFVQKQEVTQLFKRQKRVKHYFPIASRYKYEILQMDIADLSNLSSVNKNYNYLLCAIDVFSRLAFVVPMKNKTTSDIIDATKEIVDSVAPAIINCDNGSEFTSKQFKDLMKKRGITINYVDVGDHHKLGVIDRFVRTLRERINKYLEMHNTTKYIDVLPKLVYNYNHSYHSAIKKKPIEVTNEDENVIELTNRKWVKAKKEETKFNDGDLVRYILNRKQFEKGTLPKFSKVVHKIVSHTEHTYILENGKTYKYYELQKISDVQKLEKQQKEPTREQLRQQNTKKRRFNRTGLTTSDILTTKRTPQPIRKYQVE